MPATTSRSPLRWHRPAVLVTALVLLLGACGDDDATTVAADGDRSADPATERDGDGEGDSSADPDGPGSSDDGGDGAPTDGPSSGSGIAFDTLGERCEELTDIATTLRGAAPDAVRSESIPPEPSPAYVGDEIGFHTVGCIFSYGDESLRDPNRVWLSLERPVPDRADDPEVTAFMWSDLARAEEPEGVGDAALFHQVVGLDARSVLHVRVGDQFLRVRVSTPVDQADERLAEPGPFVAAAQELLDRLDL